jgi:hypothetical protein
LKCNKFLGRKNSFFEKKAVLLTIYGQIGLSEACRTAQIMHSRVKKVIISGRQSPLK